MAKYTGFLVTVLFVTMVDVTEFRGLYPDYHHPARKQEMKRLKIELTKVTIKNLRDDTVIVECVQQALRSRTRWIRRLEPNEEHRFEDGSLYHAFRVMDERGVPIGFIPNAIPQ